MDITVTPGITPTFASVAEICAGDILDPLPTSSIEGITGSWTPALDNSATTEYTFTPDAGQCAVPATLTITVNPGIIPAFSEIGVLCQNSSAPALSSTSLNGVTGTWSPSAISTSEIGTFTYTFTPDPGQCAEPVTTVAEITGSIIPAFDQIGPLCQHTIAPALNSTSLNGISGTWSPSVINTSVVGTFTYTFTPAAGQCSEPVRMEVEITSSITPAFNQIGSLCQNSVAPTLPATSLNGISGTWSPSEINTAAAGTFMFTFTPWAAQCAETTTMSVEITPERIPTFIQIGPLLLNSTAPSLPSVSIEGITGNWNPSVISTAATGTTTYTFVPTTGQCATNTTMDITVVSTDLSISKIADVSIYRNVGDEINYTITVTNNGNVVLTSIDVTDPLTGLNQTIASLDPGVSVTFNTTYVITQDDINAGQVQNTATAAYTYAGQDHTDAR